MTLVLTLALLVAIWYARRRPMLPRDRAMYLSERWRAAHLYDHGKHRPEGALNVD